MLFSSHIFIFLFLPLALIGFYQIRNRQHQLVFLFLSSIVFYSYWSFKYVFLLLFTVVFDFYIAKAIGTESSQIKKKKLLLFSIITNLSILFMFKYFNFFISAADGIYHMFSPSAAPLGLSFNVILPIGISFYTFQSMSYVIDVYRGTSKVHDNLLAFASYVTLFPHQISGPLVRHNFIVPQLEDKKTYSFNFENFYIGCGLFVLGLSKKILIADQVARVASPLIHSMNSISTTEAWLAMLGYTVQLYFDFSGYTDMAIGLGKMMNIEFPINFNSPYKSKSITEFWQRWHITLSSWLRDYLYISLGGNRQGLFNTYRNLFLTMLIGGLWHGANFTFVIWGAYHGGLLVLEKFLSSKVSFKIHSVLKIFITFMLVNVGWVFFRSDTVSDALLWLKKVFVINETFTWTTLNIITKYKDRFFLALVLGLILIFVSPNTFQIRSKLNQKKYVVLLAILFITSLLFLNDESPFLYFQF